MERIFDVSTRQRLANCHLAGTMVCSLGSLDHLTRVGTILKTLLSFHHLEEVLGIEQTQISFFGYLNFPVSLFNICRQVNIFDF